MKFSHSEVLAEIRSRPGIRCRSTHRAIKHYIIRLEIEAGVRHADVLKMLEEEWPFIYRPDGFIIDREKKELHVYEVEDFHRIGNARLSHYFDFFDWLGEFGIEGVLHIFNRFGVETILYVGDLIKPFGEYYTGKLCDDDLGEKIARQIGLSTTNSRRQDGRA